MKRKYKKRPSPLLYILPVLLVLLLLTFFLILYHGRNDPSSDPSGTDPVTDPAALPATLPDTLPDTLPATEPAAEPETAPETPPVTEPETVPETEPETVPETDPPVPAAPLGIYVKENGVYRRKTEYVSTWPQDDSDPRWTKDTWTYSHMNLICDVAYFDIIPSTDDTVTLGGWDTDWVARMADAGLDPHRIGFSFTIFLNDGTSVSFDVLSPKDTFLREDFFELYLYDAAAHAHDSWYSHVTESTCTDATAFTTVKITLRSRCYEIDRIEMTAFVTSPTGQILAQSTCVIRDARPFS